jgi:hypothetical protein
MLRIRFFLLFLLSANDLLFGGLLHVFPESILLNDKDYSGSLGLFTVSEQITMEFKYENAAYGGKPIQYGVFKLYEVQKNQKKNSAKYFMTRIETGLHQGRITFMLDKPGAKYVIYYQVLPFFDNHPLISNSYFIEDENLQKILSYYAKPENINVEEELISIVTRKDTIPPPDSNSVFLYIENQKKIFEDIDQNKALRIKWYIGQESTKKATNIKYSYSLDPIEDWTIFNDDRSADYYYLRPGYYTFNVKARYDVDSKSYESNVAKVSFTVKNLIFKIMEEKGVRNAPKYPPIEGYNKSKALLIGVTKYTDYYFSTLPFVDNDINLIGSILKTDLSFEVETLTKETTKLNIERRIESFFNNAQKNDRLILYFSGHGTSVGEAGFLVPSDGSNSSKTSTCISFDFLSKKIDNLLTEKGVRHFLIIIDACQAGLGVYSKSTSDSPLFELSKFNGAHMMTAGLMEQNALADNNNSIFTKYLAKGLKGDADYNDDKIITLNELLVYVQNNVSEYAKRKANANQTPMLGKIKGNGEMIFILKK